MDNVKSKKNLIYKSLTSWILLISFSVSFTALVIYFAEADFTDDVLYILLITLRYSAFLICLCAIHKMAMHIYGVIRKYKFRPKRFAIFLSFFIYGVGVIFLESLIVAISRGNG